MVEYGFLGSGTITRAMVTGLSTTGGEVPGVALSPRNATISAELDDRFVNVHVCASNAEVVEAADTVVLAVRPQDASHALSHLPFRDGQTVISVMGGISIAELAQMVSPATNLARAIPLPEVAQGSGVVVVYPPPEPGALQLFIPTVTVIPRGRPDQMTW